MESVNIVWDINGNIMMKYNKEKPLKVVTLCSGYDSMCLAFNRLMELYPDFAYDLIAWSEFDPETPNVPLEKQPAVIAHNALFPEHKDKNLGDMTKIDWSQVADFDLLFYSTPCQSVSQAGLQHGFSEGSGTRSSIIWNVRDCVKAKRPKFLMLENVRAMVSRKFVGLFNLWQRELENLGYVNFAQVLNAKDFNVPQNRERIFLISIRIDDDEDYPKYFFPQPIPLKVCLADVLEEEVEDKYFLSDEMLARFCEKSLEEEDAPARNRSDECDGDDCEDEDDFENFFVAQ
jgi:DNA (cytosine-5)-methyltransferase 1